ncbi:MAG: hypothetical protein ACRDX8_14630 [Acidimicrobiales bacterium]
MSGPSVGSIQHPDQHFFQSLELPVEEVLRRAKPLPPYEETVIQDLTDEEEEAFWAATTE